jgi:hypothetical protein
MIHPQNPLPGVLQAHNDGDVVYISTTVGQTGVTSVTHVEALGRTFGPIYGSGRLPIATVKELKGGQLHVYTTITDIPPTPDIATYALELSAGADKCPLAAPPFAIPKVGDGAFYQSHVVVFKV